MSDIDYSKFSYKDYKNNKSSYKNKKGQVRYNFISYQERPSYTPTYDKSLSNPIIEDPINDNTCEVNDKKASDTESEDVNIEDLRSKKKAKMRMPNSSTTTRGHSRQRDIVAVLMVVICFCLTIVSADIISGGEIFNNLAEVLSSNNGAPIYYAVEVGSFPDIESARATSEVYRLRNAGGYVINDGSYRVIAAVYANKNDAETIVEKLISDGLSGSIYEIRGAKVNWDKYGEVGKDIEAAVNQCDIIYNRLYEISNNLNKELITEQDAKLEIKALQNEIEATRNVFMDKTKDYAYDDTVLMVRAELAAYIAILENLNNDTIPRPSLLADIRYSYTMIAHMYCKLLRTLR